MRLALAFICLPLFGTEIHPGAQATIHATGDGKPAPAFEYFRNGVKVGSGPQYVIKSATTADAGYYTIHGSNGIGPGATSQPILVTVGVPPVITSPFPNRMVRKKGGVILAVTTSGAGLSFQWKKGNAILTGADGPSLTISDAKPPDGGYYTVTVSNVYGSVSAMCRVIVQ